MEPPPRKWAAVSFCFGAQNELFEPTRTSHDSTIQLMSNAISTLLQRWREDAGGTYRTWFLWEERLKNFRSIRRGLAQVVQEIEAGTFGNLYKGSSLETVVGSIAETKRRHTVLSGA